MLYLVHALSAWLTAALAFGLVVGYVTCKAGQRTSWTGGAVLALVLYAVGAAAALLQVLPGRHGFWLETALLMVAAYGAGCAIGCLLRSVFAGLRAAQMAPDATLSGLAQETQALTSHAAALAAVAPAAFEASSAAQALLSGAAAAASAAPEASAPSLADSVQVLVGHVEALVAAAPAALAASSAAQALLSGEALDASAVPDAPDPSLGDDPKTLADHAEALVASAPAALAQEGALVAAQEPAEEPGKAPVEKLSPASIPRLERAGEEDDLRLIRGIGEKTSQELNELGIWRFAQIAAWTPEQEARVAEKLAHCGPVARNFWVAQAQLLAAGVETDHARAVLRGEARHAHEAIDEAGAGALRAALPQVIAPHANDEIYAGQRPLSLLHPPQGEKDDLARIAGIDAEIAERLNALGIWTFAQIAHWSDMNVRWIGSYLAFPGRIERENWLAQARALAAAKIGAA